MSTKGFELEIMACIKIWRPERGQRLEGNVKRKKKICLSKFGREQKDWSAKKFRWVEGRLLVL